jgi:serine/threonine protein kinase/tetratricopeptide (TPR) repeat protein
LDDETRQLLVAMVDRHLALHDNNAEKSLQSVSSLGSVRDELRSLADPDINASLVNVEGSDDEDRFATIPHVIGASTSDGSRFRVLRFHADGGLGKVSVAIDNELNREVALKEIKEKHADNLESRARFTAEAKITGKLEHPGIVPVYGMGASVDGRPYYAMRFIHGQSLQDAIQAFHQAEGKPKRAERALELRRLLQHFLAACNAIHYAHSRGVLHRDIKPANIMLGKFGETLVVDWGLAKATGKSPSDDSQDAPVYPEELDSPPLTMLGSAVGTPSFMSPEQAAGRIHELSPASDVFSLGATLYHLLTGEPPYKGKDSHAVLEAARKGDFIPPRQRDSSIPRALDAICRKAMAKSPAERYSTAQGLADDITRWAADEPVLAHREPWSARVARVARRNRGWTMSAAAALVLVTVISIGAVLQVSRARNRETVALSTQQSVSKFFTDLFKDVDPFGPEGFSHELRNSPVSADTTARELLKASDERLKHELKDQPSARAEFLETIGNVYRSLGLYGQANTILQESLDLRQEHDPANRSAIALNQRNLAWSLHYYGDYKAAAPLYEQALATLEEIHGADDPEVASTKQQFALLLSDAQVGEFEEALNLMHEVIDSRQRVFGPKTQAVAIAYSAQALALFAKGDVDGGRVAAARAGNIFSKERDSSHFGTAMHSHLRGLDALEKRNTDEALQLLNDAVEEFKKIMPADHAFVALALVQHAGALLESKRYREAEERLNEARRITAHLRPDHPKITDIRWHFALLYLESDRGCKAKAELEENQRQMAAAYGANSWQYAKACEELGSLLFDLGRNEDAVKQLTQAVNIVKQVDARRPDRAAYVIQKLAEMLAELGRFPESIEFFEQAIALRRKPGSNSKLLADNLVLLGQAQLEAGRLQAAQDSLTSAKKQLLDSNRFNWAARAQALLGDALLRNGQTEQAEQELTEALKVISDARPSSHNWNVHIRRALVALYTKIGQAEKAALYNTQSEGDSKSPRFEYRLRMGRFPHSAQPKDESDL